MLTQYHGRQVQLLLTSDAEDINVYIGRLLVDWLLLNGVGDWGLGDVNWLRDWTVVSLLSFKLYGSSRVL